MYLFKIVQFKIYCSNESNGYGDITSKIEAKVEKFNNPEVVAIKDFKSLNDFVLVPYFLNSIAYSPSIKCRLDELDRMFQVFIESMNASGQLSLDFNNLKQRDLNLHLKFGDIFSHIQQFFRQNRERILYIWKDVNDLLEKFISIYFKVITLKFQKKIKELSLEIREIIFEKMQLMLKIGKIDQITILSEENEIFFLKIQIKQIHKEIESNIQQAKIYGFNMENVHLIDVENFMKSKTITINEFIETLDLEGKIEKEGIIFVSPENIVTCSTHLKLNPIPLDIDVSSNFSKQTNGDQLFKSIEFESRLSFNKILQIIYNLYTNKIPDIMKELYLQGTQNYEKLINLIKNMENNITSMEEVRKVYIENFRKELIKFEINASNLISLLKYLDSRMLNILLSKHELYIQICSKKMELIIHSLSALIVSELIMKYNKK